MLVLVDILMLCHSFGHVGINPKTESPADPYDVAERVREKFAGVREFLLEKPQFVGAEFVAVFDQPKPRVLFRHDWVPEYKSGRTEDPLISEAEEATRESFIASEFMTLTASYGLECDDLIASAAKQYNGKVVIFSEDRDYHQCLEDGRVGILKKCNKDIHEGFQPVWFTAKKLWEKHGVRPDQWPAYQAMVGGKDDVPGWGGCGPKKATEILQLEGVRIDLLDQDERVKVNKTQRESYPQFSNDYDKILRVRTLRTDVPMGQLFMKEVTA